MPTNELHSVWSSASDWFINKYMQEHSSNFQFMFVKLFKSTEDLPDSIEIGSITITRQSDVKLLGMTN